MAAHPQVTIRLGDGSSFEVDVGIARLVHALWVCDRRTTSSCERLPGTSIAYITFEKAEDAEEFAQLIDGTIHRPPAEEVERARNEGDPSAVGDVVSVRFPTDSISDALGRVEGTMNADVPSIKKLRELERLALGVREQIDEIRERMAEEES
jgi:hypothetical protein